MVYDKHKIHMLKGDTIYVSSTNQALCRIHGGAYFNYITKNIDDLTCKVCEQKYHKLQKAKEWQKEKSTQCEKSD